MIKTESSINIFWTLMLLFSSRFLKLSRSNKSPFSVSINWKSFTPSFDVNAKSMTHLSSKMTEI
jgi:hypothetical protein